MLSTLIFLLNHMVLSLEAYDHNSPLWASATECVSSIIIYFGNTLEMAIIETWYWLVTYNCDDSDELLKMFLLLELI